MKPTFDDFVASRIADQRRYPKNSYVSHPEWRHLYVRVSPRYVNRKMWPLVIDLANIEAKVTGKGAFRRLVAHVQETYPTAGIFVESVLPAQFCAGLLRMGFFQIQNSFFLEPKKQG